MDVQEGPGMLMLEVVEDLEGEGVVVGGGGGGRGVGGDEGGEGGGREDSSHWGNGYLDLVSWRRKFARYPRSLLKMRLGCCGT